jgi:hypothetical protein
MREVINIQAHMDPVISDVYTEFLKTSSDLETRQYSDPSEEIRVNLIHKNYMSQKDLEVCGTYDLAPLLTHPNFADIHSLHTTLVNTYTR